MNWILVLLRLCTQVYDSLTSLWTAWFFPNLPHPYQRYFLSDEYEFDEDYTHVPEDSVYVEEWMKDGEKKCVVRYEGEEIPRTWTRSPFEMPVPPCPWVWVGDRETEMDLTRTFQKFLVPGNQILLDLVLKLIKVTDRTRLIYIDSRTFEEREFPGDGITIHA